jgi:hypothetical protein
MLIVYPMNTMQKRRPKMQRIVTYDGQWPNACNGALKIEENGKVVYEKQFCCTSEGYAGCDTEGNEYVRSGRLTWDDAADWPQKIQDAVQAVLDDVDVCCGGCI